MTYDIFFYEAFEEEAEAIQRYMPDSVNAGYTWKTIQEYGETQPPAPILSLRTQSIMPREWANDMKGWLSRSTGYNHLQSYRADCPDANLFYGYLPLYCNRGVAEHALALWMGLLRTINKQQRQFPTFLRDGITGGESAEKTLAVFGVGRIGSEVVDIGKGLRMKVLGVDIDPKHDDVEFVSKEKALSEADIVVCAMNLTPNNRGYFTEELLRNCKKGAIFVNISRGECSPSATLLKLLKEGLLSGVGLDVYNEEEALAGHLRAQDTETNEEIEAVKELMLRDDAICTPHNAFNTREAVERKSEQSVQQYLHLQENDKFLWDVPEL